MFSQYLELNITHYNNGILKKYAISYFVTVESVVYNICLK